MVKLTLETAKKMYLEGGAGKDFALDNFEEEQLKGLPKSWEELETVKGYYVSTKSKLISDEGDTFNYNRNIFATKEQAEASIALAQLTQLMKAYNGDWVADWRGANKYKWSLFFIKEEISIRSLTVSNRFLAFKSEDLAEQFLENFKDLIETAKPLL